MLYVACSGVLNRIALVLWAVVICCRGIRFYCGSADLLQIRPGPFQLEHFRENG